MSQTQPIRRHRMWCAVCGKPANFHYYGVSCCEACKLFFRRAIVGHKLWPCANWDRKCKVVVNRNGEEGGGGGKSDGASAPSLCRGCRLDKCLRVGMNWRHINLSPSPQLTGYLYKLRERKRHLLGTAAESDGNNGTLMEVPKLLITDRCQDNQELRRLSHLIKCHQRIWHAFEHLPDNYLDKFQSLDDLLTGSNILGHADEFMDPLDRMDPAQLVSEMERMDTSLGHPWLIKLVVVDRLIAVGMTMAMPFFKKLSLNDQAILVRHVAVPSTVFFNSFYSVQLGASTWSKRNGFTAISLFRCKHYASDDRLTTFADRECNGSMIPFLRTRIGELDEFGLLLAILHSHSAVHGLSPGAKSLLYSESVRYSAILLRLLQCRLGPAAGATRFADYLHLVETAFHSGRAHALFSVYMQAFDMLREVPLVPFPKCLIEII